MSPTPTIKGKKSRMVTLSLPSSLLSRFQSTPPVTTKEEVVQPPTQQPSPSSAETKSEANATPVPSQDAAATAAPKVDRRRKRAPPSINPNTMMRERARPGPKKKPRLADGTIDHTTSSTTAASRPNGAAIPAHRLGPKANTGAINAGLRALDRTGKPCRKWERKGLTLKSFTGTIWDLASWKAPPKEGKSNEGSVEDKSVVESSRVGSERGSSRGEREGNTMMTMGSSPGIAV
ncbi:uncharacterized protein RCC_02025 [Ramularia collo-cygni]|uniref:MUC1 Extracellular alpha-1,4-glucan glucosidase n=1 Tax=Ramularia collo-cygni TaxID=112498 RepID=A0A2D3V754_9PEZI|nr:uncharacterized protein RCC_02025 [Ramularia collo-cygni]CZT16183.1 uncharacterized protein RCC_02025 [Ramularia collo-cygni]